MNDPQTGGLSRRDLLKTTGRVAAASALAGVMIPKHVYAAGDETIRLALVGCGGRGTGAAGNALDNTSGPTKLVAMGDVLPDRLAGSYRSLSDGYKEKVDVPEDRRFLGFEAFKQAMDCLRAGDVVILATPPAFRWPMFRYAIDKGLNVFMEKPITVDGPSTRRMLELADESEQKNLKVGVGLMCRHCHARKELFDRVQNGEIGDILLLRAYRVAGPTASAFSTKKPDGMNELEYQIRNFHSFLWASGGAFSDFLIHNIDECCWIKNAWPVSAKGFGGRHYRLDYVDQNFDTYTTEYTFPDGSKLMLEGRCMTGCYNEFASYAHGSKGSAVISTASHSPARCRIYKGQNMQGKTDLVWAYPQPEPNPYQLEWNDLIQAIREDQKYNEVRRGAEASLVTSMGRMACHTGQEITRDEILNSEHEFAPTVAQLSFDGPAPLVANSEGKYPVPQPGITKKTEY